jgi:putative transposase
MLHATKRASSCICNFDHRRSSIRCVGPAQHHDGDDHRILAALHEVYVQARERFPAGWSGCTRDWKPSGAATLHPEHKSVITMASHTTRKQPWLHDLGDQYLTCAAM